MGLPIMKRTTIRICAALVLLGLFVVVPRSLFAAELVKFNSASIVPSPFAIKKAKAKGIELKAEPGEPLTGLLGSLRATGLFLVLFSCMAAREYEPTATPLGHRT